MRLWLLSVLVLCIVSTSQGQRNFLDGIREFLNRLNPFRPQQSSRPTSSSSTPQFSTGSTVVGSSQPTSVNSEALTFTVPSSQPSQSVASTSAPSSPLIDALSFSAPSSPSGDSLSFSAPSSPSGDALSFSAPSSSQTFGQLRLEPIATPGRGNHNFDGKRFLLTWREGNEFPWFQARDYCRENDMNIVSLNDPRKREHFLQLVFREGVEHFWTGGQVLDESFLNWDNGNSELIEKGFHPWSSQGLNGPQPDGRGGENCLAILNNFFNDGIKYHDENCQLVMPTVCEA